MIYLGHYQIVSKQEIVCDDYNHAMEDSEKSWAFLGMWGTSFDIMGDSNSIDMVPPPENMFDPLIGVVQDWEGTTLFKVQAFDMYNDQEKAQLGFLIRKVDEALAKYERNEPYPKLIKGIVEMHHDK